MKKLILMGAVFMGLYANALNIKFTAEGPLCSGAATGTIDVIVNGGTSPFTYNWSNGASGANLTGLLEGSYTVTVHDNLGALAVSTIVIAGPPAIQITPTVIDVSSPGGSDGGVILNVRGGTADYSYLWTNSAITKNILNVAAGTYSVTVTDANGCVASATSTVSESGNMTQIQGGNNNTGNGHMIMGSGNHVKDINTTIYPNPANNMIYVRVPEGGSSEYSIFNTTGQELLKSKFSTIETGIDVTGLPTGNYVAKIKSLQGTMVKNIVIAK